MYTDTSTVAFGLPNSAVVYGIANNTVGEGTKYAAAYRVANNTLAHGAANNAVAYGVVNNAVCYTGNGFNVLMHMGFNYFDVAVARMPCKNDRWKVRWRASKGGLSDFIMEETSKKWEIKDHL